jgi:hypothetical protein
MHITIQAFSVKHCPEFSELGSQLVVSSKPFPQQQVGMKKVDTSLFLPHNYTAQGL